jgi:site-specific recombinase
MGATLATKQPAMTASTLAATLDESAASHSAMEALAEVIVRTVRSQLAALFGNFLFAFPTALLIAAPFTYGGVPLMSQATAHHYLESLHGLHSLSFLYAALAGVCLFVAGLLAGVADNWFVFNHVGSRLRHSEVLRKMVGAHNLDRAIQTIDHNLGFWVGNMALGFFLGCMPALGAMTGLPLDIRHITFSSAQFGASLMSLQFHVPLMTSLAVAATVFLIGLINLAVSFSLTLFVVVKSRRIRFSQTPLLLRKLGRRLRQRPLEFFIPMRDPA